MVSADLESLVASHNQSGLAILLVLEQANITSSSLLPFARFLGELEQLCAHFEQLLLGLLVGLGLNLFGELDDGLKMDILALGGLFLQR